MHRGVVLPSDSRRAKMAQITDHGDSAADIFFTGAAPPLRQGNASHWAAS